MRRFESPIHGHAGWDEHGPHRIGASADRGLLERMQKLAEANERAMQRIGRVDHVTGLPTRTQLMADWAGAVAAGAGSLILVTLADARHYNDLLRALGHAYAEDFVRAGAARLMEALPDGVELYHVSVLSFAFLSEEDAAAAPPPVVARIVEAFRHSLRCQDIPVDTRAGVGVASIDAAAAAPAEMLRATLTAAQDSRKGFDGWARYDRSSDEAHRRAFRLLADLPAAFRSDSQLSLHYQPRIAMQEGRCTGAEALIRWQHPEFGAIAPSEFVPLAESTALIAPLTRWVMENGLRTAARWDRERIPLKLSINVSPRNLEEPNFVEFVIAVANRFDVDPSAIELEFTEGALAANPPLMLEQLGRLRRHGFDIAVDDFGSGYSNMSHLVSLPAKVLKVDQSFIRPLESDRRKQLLVRSIIELAHTLDYSVVAEGIETRAAFGLLCGWDCDEGQGFFMSRPLPLAAFGEWYEARGARQLFYD